MSVVCRRFRDAPTEGVDRVVTVSHYSLLKFFYFIACLGTVILNFNKGKLISPFYNFIWRTQYIFHFRGVDNFSYTCSLKIYFSDCSFTLRRKQCAFETPCGDGNNSKLYQRCFANYIVVKELHGAIGN